MYLVSLMSFFLLDLLLTFNYFICGLFKLSIVFLSESTVMRSFSMDQKSSNSFKKVSTSRNLFFTISLQLCMVWVSNQVVRSFCVYGHFRVEMFCWILLNVYQPAQNQLSPLVARSWARLSAYKESKTSNISSLLLNSPPHPNTIKTQIVRNCRTSSLTYGDTFPLVKMEANSFISQRYLLARISLLITIYILAEEENYSI